MLNVREQGHITCDEISSYHTLANILFMALLVVLVRIASVLEWCYRQCDKTLVFIYFTECPFVQACSVHA